MLRMVLQSGFYRDEISRRFILFYFWLMTQILKKSFRLIRITEIGHEISVIQRIGDTGDYWLIIRQVPNWELVYRPNGTYAGSFSAHGG